MAQTPTPKPALTLVDPGALGVKKQLLTTPFAIFQPDSVGMTIGLSWGDALVLPTDDDDGARSYRQFLRMYNALEERIPLRSRNNLIAAGGEATYRVALGLKAIKTLVSADIGYASPVSVGEYGALVAQLRAAHASGGTELTPYEMTALWVSLGGPGAHNAAELERLSQTIGAPVSEAMKVADRRLTNLVGNCRAKRDEEALATYNSLERGGLGQLRGNPYVETHNAKAREAMERAEREREHATELANHARQKAHERASTKADKARMEAAIAKLSELGKRSLIGGPGMSGRVMHADEEMMSEAERTAYRYAHGHIDLLAAHAAKDPQWGVMYIQQPALFPVHRLAETAGFKASRPSEDGVNIRDVWRYASDGKIFSHRGRGAGGTVLIDMSGSMSVSDQSLFELVLSIPHGLVALYDGDRNHGDLWIAAKQGRMTTVNRIARNGNNLIDGPALRWLARQAKPRYWVSDGQATAVNHSGIPRQLVLECQRIAGENHIVQIGSMKEALEYFRTVRRTRREHLLRGKY